MKPEPVMGPLTWCPDCLWQEGEMRTIDVLEYSYDSYTPRDELEFIEVNRMPCGCDPDDYDSDDYEDLGKTIKAAWRCGGCKMIYYRITDAESCCPEMVVVPKGATISFSNGRAYVSASKNRVYVKETADYVITDRDGHVLERV
jgi:hypothetical protein